MELSAPFPDVEVALVVGLRDAVVVPGGGALRVRPDFKPDDETAIGADGAHIRVILIDNPDDWVTAQALVEVDVFAEKRSVGYAVAEQVRGIMNSSRRLGDITIDRSRTVSGPKSVPWDDNQRLVRFMATYRISTRRQ